MLATQRANDLYADLAGKPRLNYGSIIPAAPQPRQSKPRASGGVLERDVLRQIVKALRSHPSVSSVERNQSGLFRDGERYIRVGTVGKLDLTIYLTDGRYAEIEVKRPGGRATSAQAERIQRILSRGGLAGVASSVEQALQILGI